MGDLGLTNQLRVRWRRSWTDAWTDDVGTVSIQPWIEAGGNKSGSCTLIAITANANNREAGAAACPLRQGDFVQIITKRRLQFGELQQTERIWWTGWIIEDAVEPRGGQDSQNQPSGVSNWPASQIEIRRMTAIGLGGMLAQIDCHRWWRGSGANYAASPGLGLPQVGTGRIADMISRFDQSLIYGKRGARTPTIREFLQAMLVWHQFDIDQGGTLTRRFPHWPLFEISNLGTQLDTPVANAALTGTLMDMMTRIVHPRRGLIWSAQLPAPNHPDSIAGKVYLRCDSTLEEAITIAAPGVASLQLPANNRLKPVLDASLPHTSIRWAASCPPRRLLILGRRRVAMASLRWSRDGTGVETGALSRVWSSADDAKAGQRDPRYADVFRTFTLREGWTGGTYGFSSASLARTMTTEGTAEAPDPLYGVAGFTGSCTDGDGTFPELAVEFLDHLPMPSAATNATGDKLPINDWLTGTSGVTLDGQATPIRPTLFVHHRASNTWEVVKLQISFPGPRTVQIGSGPEDAQRLAGRLAALTDDLVLTCAVVEPYPFAVSYVPPIAAGGIKLGADRKKDCTWAESIRVLPGTVFGLSAALAPIYATAERSVRDDLQTLRTILRLARPYGERPAGAIFRDRLSLRPELSVGQLVQQAAVARPYPADYHVEIGYIITSIRRDPALPNFGCEVTIEASELDLESIA